MWRGTMIDVIEIEWDIVSAFKKFTKQQRKLETQEKPTAPKSIK